MNATETYKTELARLNMRGTMNLIGRHMISRTKSAVVQPSAPRLIAEWQQRGPETLSGLAVAKLRLTLVPTQRDTT
jgi:hypothetical protein